jgi:hypothetical protein
LALYNNAAHPVISEGPFYRKLATGSASRAFFLVVVQNVGNIEPFSVRMRNGFLVLFFLLFKDMINMEEK